MPSTFKRSYWCPYDYLQVSWVFNQESKQQRNAYSQLQLWLQLKRWNRRKRPTPTRRRLILYSTRKITGGAVWRPNWMLGEI